MMYFHAYQVAEILGVDERSIHRATDHVRRRPFEWIKRRDIIVVAGFRHEEGPRGCKTYLVARYSAIAGGYKLFDRTASGKNRWMQTTWGRKRFYWEWLATFLQALLEWDSLRKAEGTDTSKVYSERFLTVHEQVRPPPHIKQAFSNRKLRPLAQYFARPVLDHLANESLLCPDYGHLVGLLFNLFTRHHTRPRILEVILFHARKMRTFSQKLKNPTGYLFSQVNESLRHDEETWGELTRLKLAYTWIYQQPPLSPPLDDEPIQEEETQVYTS